MKDKMDPSWQKLVPLPEPSLEFRYGQRVRDPRDGLALFGPADADLPGSPKSISYGLVGTTKGVNSFREFTKFLRFPTISPGAFKNPRLWPPFPGFDIAFDCKFPEREVRVFELDEKTLIQSSRINDANQRAYSVVEHYLTGIKNLRTKSDEQLGVVICIVPE